MPINPWDYAAKTQSEHAEQVALMMWANMAENYGLKASLDLSSYMRPGIAKAWLEQSNDRVAQLKWLHAIKNQRDGDNRIAGAKAKAEGVKPGVSDLFLPVAKSSVNFDRVYHGLYIELKRKDAGAASAIQLEFQADMRQAGYKCEIIHGWEAARDCIVEYLGLT